MALENIKEDFYMYVKTLYIEIADIFAKMNYAVHLIDLRGFGYSGGPRGS